MTMDGSAAPFRAGDAVRLTREVAGTPAGSAGEVLGWYVGQPDLIVRLRDGGVQRIPEDALEPVAGHEALDETKSGDAE